MLLLGIETSCDETAAAVVSDGPPAERILSNLVFSQLEEHRLYGGVVPEIAARSHLERIDSLVTRALEEASLDLDDLDAIAATCGPGLIGGGMGGMVSGQAIAAVKGKAFIGAPALRGHVMTVQ